MKNNDNILSSWDKAVEASDKATQVIVECFSDIAEVCESKCTEVLDILTRI